MEKLDRMAICSAAEAAAHADTVNKLQQHWVARDQSALFTLGAAAYLDAPTPETVAKFGLPVPEDNAYEVGVEKFNPVLKGAFAVLYDDIRLALAGHLGTEVHYAPGKAYPGFHVFNHHPQYASPTAQVPHYDRQYEALQWGQPVTVENARTLSFTLLLKMPASGAGLMVWNVYLQDILGLDKAQAIEKIKQARTWREDYAVGELVLHPGHQLHRIAPWQSNEQEQRITLQGHALYINDCWMLYW